MSIPLITMFHQSQLPATPCAATRPVTTSGVSAANVVATIEAPASHQARCGPTGSIRSRLSPPFFVKRRPMPVGKQEIGDDDRPVNRSKCHEGRDEMAVF